MQARGVSQAQLAERAGIAVSRVNNYAQGNYRTMKPAHLLAIVTALGGKPANDSLLVQAYLYDLLPERCRGTVEIRVPGARESGKWEVPSKGLPEGFADAFRDLYVLCASNARVRQRTAQWVAIMRETSG